MITRERLMDLRAHHERIFNLYAGSDFAKTQAEAIEVIDLAIRAIDLEAEVARLHEAMPSEEELRLCMECVGEADHLHTHWDVVYGWLDRIEKARGG